MCCHSEKKEQVAYTQHVECDLSLAFQTLSSGAVSFDMDYSPYFVYCRTTLVSLQAHTGGAGTFSGGVKSLPSGNQV